MEFLKFLKLYSFGMHDAPCVVKVTLEGINAVFTLKRLPR